MSSSSLTLDLIRSSQVGTPGFVAPSTSFSTPSAPVPARRTETRGAYHPQVAMSRPSEAQTNFIKSLLADIAELDAEQGEKLRTLANECWTEGKMTPGRDGGASSWIENLKDLRAALRDRAAKAAPKTPVERPAVPAGHYAIDTLDGATNETAFYQVRVSDTGFISVYHQVSDTLTKLDWAHTLPVLKRILEAGVLAASIRYGQQMGVCGVCGKALTNDESRAAGIGPVCRSRLS